MKVAKGVFFDILVDQGGWPCRLLDKRATANFGVSLVVTIIPNAVLETPNKLLFCVQL
jgi:hypothetical protein